MKKPIPFGKYFLMDRIAVGGMAEVFKAKTFGVEGFEKTVALKRILPNIAEDHEFITMFIDEAKIAVQLSHANIAQIFELGEVNGTYFIAMEYVQGKDLRTMYERARRPNGQKMSPQQAAFVVARACEGLDYAHRKKDKSGSPLNIVHRDISPQNVLISYDGDVKVIDFGVAKAQNKMGRTQAGILKGKFGYMSPEQVQGFPLDQRSDVFSLGIVLHEILTGKRLFVGESDFHTLEKIREAKAEPPSKTNPAVPEALDTIVMKALARDSNVRYQYANELQEDLQRFLYAQSPVYTRRDLAQYMRQVFQQDIVKEKKATAEYEGQFQTAPPATSNPNTPASGWMAPQQPMGPTPNSYTGLPPAAPPSPTMPPQYQMAHASQAVAYPQNPHPSVANHVSPFAQSPQIAPNHPAHYPSALDDPDSTMLDSSVSLSPSMGGGYLSSSNLGHLGGGLPATAALSIDQITPPPNYLDPNFDDGETDTVIDLSAIETSSPPKKEGGSLGKIILLSVLVVLLVAGVTFGVFYLVRSMNGGGGTDELIQPEGPSKITLLFPTTTVDGLQFFLDQEPIKTSNIKQLNNKKVELLIHRQGTFTLRIQKEGFTTFQRPLKIDEAGIELFTNVMLRPIFALVQITSKPAGGIVFINGKRQARPTPGWFRVPPKGANLRVSMSGRKSWKRSYLLKPQEKKKVSFTFSKTKALIKILCKDGGKATVFLNGKKKGQIRGKRSWVKKGLNFKKKYNIKVVPKGSKTPVFEREVDFPLEPHRKFEVACKPAPVSNVGILPIRSTPRARITIAGKDYGVTPQELKIQPGTYKILLTNLETNKQIETTQKVTLKQNSPLIILKNSWR